MKRMILLTMLMCLAAGGANADDFGLRGGFTMSPDQFHIGGHMDLGPVVESLRLVPNVEIGFGNDFTFVALNADLIHDFPETPWSVGGELGLNIVEHSGSGGSATDFGISALGNYRLLLSSGKTLMLEAKLGIVDSPDLKLTVGWNF